MNSSPSRRTFLRGTGACVGIPVFESMLSTATAAGTPQPGTTATGAPLRMAVVYKPNGVNYDQWKMEKAGQDYELSPTLKPLAGFKKDFQVFSGFEHQFGWGRLDGAGDHARANATFLTGVRPHKTAGSDIRLGISFDQEMANALGDKTRLASLELSCDGVRKSGACDSGYSCAYQYNISWRSETQPMTPESNPRLVFERLFGAGTGKERTENLKRRQVQQRSILDFVMNDAKKLHGELGRNDQQKLDEYLTGLREVEQAIEKSERFGLPPEPGISAPSGIPSNFSDHLKLMFDMMVLAFETDSTRVATFLQSFDGSNRTFPDVGVREGHHGLSHHRGKKESLDKLAKIDLFYSEHFAYFLEKLRNKKDADGNTLLHNSMILWGSGLSDPDRHRHDNLPIVLAGNGGGELTPDRHVKFGENKPMTNLFLSMSEKMGVPLNQFGDSTGRIGSI